MEYCACQTENRQADKHEGSRLAELKKPASRMYGFELLSFVHDDYEINLNIANIIDKLASS
jgi:hypothetical protein